MHLTSVSIANMIKYKTNLQSRLFLAFKKLQICQWLPQNDISSSYEYAGCIYISFQKRYSVSMCNSLAFISTSSRTFYSCLKQTLITNSTSILLKCTHTIQVETGPLSLINCFAGVTKLVWTESSTASKQVSFEELHFISMLIRSIRKQEFVAFNSHDFYPQRSRKLPQFRTVFRTRVCNHHLQAFNFFSDKRISRLYINWTNGNNDSLLMYNEP